MYSMKAEELIDKFAQSRGQSAEEVIASFEEILDKFEADGEKGRAALKFLGFSERPTAEKFIEAVAGNPDILKALKK